MKLICSNCKKETRDPVISRTLGGNKNICRQCIDSSQVSSVTSNLDLIKYKSLADYNILLSGEKHLSNVTDTIKYEGSKHDTGKPMCELLSPQALLGTTQVLTFGAKKYASHNWRKGIVWSRLIGAIFRHMFAILSGEDLDPESGLPHIDHVACEVMFLQEFYRTRKDLDDRYKPVSNKKE